MNKITPKLYKKLIDSIAFICLILVFFFTFFYLKNWQKDKIEERQKTSTVWKERKKGTWCTIKSNSLDGIPLYNKAGGNVAIGSLPEGKLCNLIESTKKERKEVAWKVETLSRVQQIHFREKPGENQRSIAKVPENTYLEMSAFKNGWGKTEFKGQEGWVKLSYLTPCKKKN